MDCAIVWIGKYQEDMGTFQIWGSISKYGQEHFNHFVYTAHKFCSYDDFIVEKINYFIAQNNTIKFYFYDQNLSHRIKKRVNIEDKVICNNSEDILAWLNNKSISREWIRNIVKTPETVVLSNTEIEMDYLKKLFWGYNRFVAQNMVSSGGHKTYLIDSEHPNCLENDLYIVSPYYENSLSINVTSIIASNNTIVFPLSVQIIEKKDSNLLYRGSDFISPRLILHIPAKQHNRPEGTACCSASNCMIAVCV